MESIYEDLIDSIEDGIVVFDPGWAIIVFNQMSERILGLSKSKAIQAGGEEVLCNNGHILEQVKKTSSTGQVFADHDSYVIKKTGEIMQVSLITSPVIGSDGHAEGTTLLIRDISRVKVLEEDIRRADSLASLGILAAGLAHEIKNPLGGIRGAAQLLEMELEEKEDLTEYTSLIVRETDRVSGLIEELLDFANPKSLTLAEVNIHEVLNAVIALFSRSEEGKNVNYATEYDPSIPSLIGDNEKLGQVILNIVKNACEAMDGKGTLTIVTRIASDYHLHESKGARTKMMALDISDEGEGISEEDMKMLFTPFFTKKRGGTGLGLALSHRIIREHEGSIKVKSKEGEGTTFSLLLPLKEGL